MKDVIDLIGRIFISVIFLFEAYDSTKYFNETLRQMSLYGLTWQPKMLLLGAIILLSLGGVLVLLGYRASLGALLLLMYWIPVTFIVHSFWNDPPELVRLQSILFMKNLAVTGGLLLVLVNGSQRFSIRRLFATTRVN
ncbi:MAG: DoxX family membrane protein [Saprospiraceae bacterium]